MVKSMTGFGRGEASDENRKFTVEIKAVNHRYFDVNVRMPKKFGYFDSALRATLKNYIQRGKIDVFVTYEDSSQENFALRYNEAIAAEYVRYFKKIAETFGLEDDIRASTIGRSPEVLELEEATENEEEIWAVLKEALVAACEKFVETRTAEGEHLADDLLDKLDNLELLVGKVEERYPSIVKEYTEKIREKAEELLGDRQIDETRLATELVLFSDKICTDEETVRLRSHIKSMRSALKGEDGVGRKLDFIAQEMNREANTILSKANDLVTSQFAIDMKTEIEKIREQIQNIE